jgi:hypothetical protein
MTIRKKRKVNKVKTIKLDKFGEPLSAYDLSKVGGLKKMDVNEKET